MKYQVQLRIWETAYGRKTGWVIEQHGQALALLSDVRPEQMFWDSYIITPISSDFDLNERMTSDEFWRTVDITTLIYRNRELDAIVDRAFPAARPFVEPGRLLMRGLYIDSRDPYTMEQIFLWFKRLLAS